MISNETNKPPLQQAKEAAFIVVLGLLFLLPNWVSKSFKISFLHAFYWLGGAFLISCVSLIFLFLKKKAKGLYRPKSPIFIFGEFIRDQLSQRKGLFGISVNDFRHVLITGVTGSGKSTLIRRFIGEITRHTFSFLMIDFKGEQKEWEETKQIMEERGLSEKLQVFDLSDPTNCLTCNLLTIFPDIAEAVGFVLEAFDLNHTFYRAEAEQFLRYSLQLFDFTETPRTFIALQKLFLDPKWRTRLINLVDQEKREQPFYLYFAKYFQTMDDRTRTENFAGLVAQLSSFTSEPLSRIFNASVSTLRVRELFEENIPTVIRIPGEAYGDLSKRIAQAFIKAIPVLLARRRQTVDTKDYFIFLDEQCSYTSETIIDILKKAGSAKVHCVLTRQCDGDFDSEGPGFLSKVISACSLSFNFLILDPETRDSLAKQMGTRRTVKQTWRVNLDGATGEASERVVREFNISADAFSELAPGECFVSARLPKLRMNQKIRIFPSHHNSQKEVCLAY